jgi:hypothetical protein
MGPAVLWVPLQPSRALSRSPAAAPPWCAATPSSAPETAALLGHQTGAAYISPGALLPSLWSWWIRRGGWCGQLARRGIVALHENGDIAAASVLSNANLLNRGPQTPSKEGAFCRQITLPPPADAVQVSLSCYPARRLSLAFLDHLSRGCPGFLLSPGRPLTLSSPGAILSAPSQFLRAGLGLQSVAGPLSSTPCRFY